MKNYSCSLSYCNGWGRSELLSCVWPFFCFSIDNIWLATMSIIYIMLRDSYCLNIVRQNVSLFRPGSSVTFSLDVLVSLLRQENAVDICVIKVPEQITYADYFIVVSGVSARHLRAMALYAIKVVTNMHFVTVKFWNVDLCLKLTQRVIFLQYKFLKKEGEPNVKIEGKDAEDWMCIDFGM